MSGVCEFCGSGVLNSGEHIRNDLPPCYGSRKKPYRGTLDDMARRYPNGTMILVQAGVTTRRRMEVIGVTWSLPLHRGWPDEPALVARDYLGTGHVYESEIIDRRPA